MRQRVSAAAPPANHMSATQRSGRTLASAPAEKLGLEVLHDLKSPLAGARALVQLGLRNPREAASHPRLSAVEREIERVLQILKVHLSSASSPPFGGADPIRVELGPLVSGVLRALKARAEEAGVRLSSQGDATVEAHPDQLEGALLNLVANGIEATPPGGTVSVEVSRTAEEIRIAVRDTGRGMDGDDLRRLGTAFFTTRAEGTGLGVMLAGSAIALHGGTLRYESEPGRGTTARATIPYRSRVA